MAPFLPLLRVLYPRLYKWWICDTEALPALNWYLLPPLPLNLCNPTVLTLTSGVQGQQTKLSFSNSHGPQPCLEDLLNTQLCWVQLQSFWINSSGEGPESAFRTTSKCCCCCSWSRHHCWRTTGLNVSLSFQQQFTPMVLDCWLQFFWPFSKAGLHPVSSVMVKSPHLSRK